MKLLKRVLVSMGPIALSLLLCGSFMTSKAYAAAPGSVSGWTAATQLPDTETYAGHAVYNDYVYIVGGYGGSSQRNTYYAHLSSDGSVGSWATASNLLPPASGLEGAGVVANNGYLYVMGGYSNTYSDLVYYAPLSADGSVGSWTAAPNLPHGVMDMGVAIQNNYVYVLGGNDGFSDQAKVYYTHLNGDGSMDNWTTAADLSQGVTTPAAVVHSNYLYLSGGVTTGVAQDIVRYAHLNNDGSIGSWTTSPNHMPHATSRQGNVVYNGYIFSFGGFDGGTTDGVYSAPLSSDGSVGAWSSSPNTLPQAEYGAAGVEHDGYIYMVGGYHSSVQKTVNYAQLEGYAVPVLTTKSATAVSGSSVTVDVLAGATGNPDPSTLRIVFGPAHGTATDPPGTITYTANAGYTGADSLVYEVCSLDDSSVCTQATLSFTVTAALQAPDTGYGTFNTTNNHPIALGLIGLTSLIAGLGILHGRKTNV